MLSDQNATMRLIMNIQSRSGTEDFKVAIFERLPLTSLIQPDPEAKMKQKSGPNEGVRFNP
jgi:hypothetical protein